MCVCVCLEMRTSVLTAGEEGHEKVTLEARVTVVGSSFLGLWSCTEARSRPGSIWKML